MIECVLLSVVRQKECLENIPRAAREEERRMLTESAAREIETLKWSLLQKSQEFAAAKTKSAELENKKNHSKLMSKIVTSSSSLRSIFCVEVVLKFSPNEKDRSSGFDTFDVLPSLCPNSSLFRGVGQEWKLSDRGG